MSIKCDVCGGQLLMNASGKTAACMSCGTLHSIDRIREMLAADSANLKDEEIEDSEWEPVEYETNAFATEYEPLSENFQEDDYEDSEWEPVADETADVIVKATPVQTNKKKSKIMVWYTVALIAIASVVMLYLHSPNRYVRSLIDKGEYQMCIAFMRQDGIVPLKLTSSQQTQLNNALIKDAASISGDAGFIFAADVLRNTSSDHKDRERLIEFMESMQNSHKNLNQYYDLWDYWNFREFALSDDNINYFMNGYWSSDGYYIEFFENDEGHTATNFELPYAENPDAASYDILDCIYVFKNENADKIQDVFKFAFNNANSVDVYCYSNGQTYTLRRNPLDLEGARAKIHQQLAD